MENINSYNTLSNGHLKKPDIEVDILKNVTEIAKIRPKIGQLPL